MHYLDNINIVELQQFIISTIQNREDLHTFVNDSSEIGRDGQDEIALVVTDGIMNDAQVQQIRDTLYENVLCQKNTYKLVFKGICKFNGQNPIICSLLSKNESGKLTDESMKKLLNKTSNLKKYMKLNQ